MAARNRKSNASSSGAAPRNAHVKQKPAALLIHGFPDTSRGFSAQTKALNTAGFRTLTPTLRGYEAASLRPDNDYHAHSLAADVPGWLDAAGIERAHLIGHDWGAIVAYAAAVRFPERVASVTLLAVPGIFEFLQALIRYPGQFRKSWYMFLFQLPYRAHSALRENDFALIDRLWADWSPGLAAAGRDERVAHIKQAFREPGVVEAAVAYYRAIFDFYTPAGLRSFRTLLGNIEAPVLAITGEDDGCLDTRMFDAMPRNSRYRGGVRVERIKSAGHWLHLEQPDAVNALILEFLRACEPLR